MKRTCRLYFAGSNNDTDNMVMLVIEHSDNEQVFTVGL